MTPKEIVAAVIENEVQSAIYDLYDSREEPTKEQVVELLAAYRDDIDRLLKLLNEEEQV